MLNQVWYNNSLKVNLEKVQILKNMAIKTVLRQISAKSPSLMVLVWTVLNLFNIKVLGCLKATGLKKI